MKKYKINHHYNYVFDPKKGEYNSGEILVQPDMAYSIEEILDRFTKGLSMPIGMDGEFPEDEPDMDDVVIRGNNIVDITDLEEVIDVVETKKKAKKQKSEDSKKVKEAEGGVNNTENQNVK